MRATEDSYLEMVMGSFQVQISILAMLLLSTLGTAAIWLYLITLFLNYKFMKLANDYDLP